jgi:hypothetical protein
MAVDMFRKTFIACTFIVATALAFSADTRRRTEKVELGDVWLVRTSGTWQKPGTYGYYRAVLYRKGGEHAEDSVRVEILQAAGDPPTLRLLREIALPDPAYSGYVQDMSFGDNTDTSIAFTLVIEPKVPESGVTRIRYNYIISADGTFKALQPPSNISLQADRER